MRKLSLLLITCSLYAATLQERITHLNTHQVEVMCNTWRIGASHDLQWTLTAIAWLESDMGERLLSPDRQDVGVFQINLISFRRRYAEQLEMYPRNDDQLRELLYDYEVGVTAAIAELTFWKKIHDGNWHKVWASYNSGWVGGGMYARAISQRIGILKQYKEGICNGSY